MAFRVTFSLVERNKVLYKLDLEKIILELDCILKPCMQFHAKINLHYFILLVRVRSCCFLFHLAADPDSDFSQDESSIPASIILVVVSVLVILIITVVLVNIYVRRRRHRRSLENTPKQ